MSKIKVDQIESVDGVADITLNNDLASLTVTGTSTLTGNVTAAGNLNTSNINGGQVSGRRNIVINGAMQIAQRGSSVSIPSSQITYTLDRFLGRPNASTDGSVGQSTDAPEGFQYSARVRRSSGQTGTLTRFEQPFETRDIIPLRGKKVTISFYAKAGSGFTPSAISVLLFEGNGTEGKRAITSYDNETTLVNTPKTLTTSWQRFTHTTTAAIASDTTQLALQFQAAWSGTAPSGDEYYITGIQLEAGETATEFEHRLTTEEFELCRRYFRAYGRIQAGAREGYSSSQISLFPGMRLLGSDAANYVTSHSAGSIRYYTTAWQTGSVTGFGFSTTTNANAIQLSINHDGVSTGSTYNGIPSAVYMDGFEIDGEL